MAFSSFRGLQAAAGLGGAVFFGDRAVYAGGYGHGSGCNLSPDDAGQSRLNTIEYLSIPTTGNTSDFGDLASGSNDRSGGMSNGSRGVFGYGNSGANSNSLEYITISTTGNASDFGDSNVSGRVSACSSNGTRGLIWAGGESCTSYNNIDYITIDTTGNATDFGDKTVSIVATGGALGSETRGLHGGGWYCFTTIKSIDYVTYDTTGNASDFGDLHWEQNSMATVSDGIRGVWCGSQYSGSPYNYGGMEYVTIDTLGNSTDFGDLTSTTACGTARDGAVGAGGTNNDTRGVIAGGNAYYCIRNDIDYITIQSAGNASSFGTMTAGCRGFGIGALSGD